MDDASNAVVDLVKAGKLDEAEAAARTLLTRYPDVHDGWDRLGMVHEARGNAHEAADCYRRVLDFLREYPDYTDDDSMERLYAGLIAKLDPPAAPCDLSAHHRSRSAMAPIAPPPQRP